MFEINSLVELTSLALTYPQNKAFAGQLLVIDANENLITISKQGLGDAIFNLADLKPFDKSKTKA